MDNNQEINAFTSNSAVDDYGQYHIENPYNMCSILKDLTTKPEVITAYYDDELRNFILTSVISVDAKKRLFILDGSPDQKRNQQLLNSKRITCKAKRNKVRVEFSVNKFKDTQYNGEFAILCELPKNILYLQRRDFYRLAVPIGDKISCCFPEINKSFNLVDISSGGIGLNEENTSKTHTLFKIYRHCEIDLGEVGAITFDLELRSTHLQKDKNNNEVLRLGYKFIELSTSDTAIIQRYIHNVDMRKKQAK